MPGFIKEMVMGSVADYCTKHSAWPTIVIRDYPLPPAVPPVDTHPHVE